MSPPWMTFPSWSFPACMILSCVPLLPSFGQAWKESQRIPAKDAFQAAAATPEQAFAINSHRITKYDRKSGQPIASSQGEAKHLNSGFLWKGSLYCAHSNYPETPELSEIKRLDINTMKLTTFKDFKDYGGSLTWAIRQDNTWWCNFAKYGSENQSTFLVQFNDDWEELARWTYPATVIQHLGQYSLSGGLWRDDELLVTGHDKPEIYRLGLPQTGKVLRYLGKENVPFTGQGIAIDPTTQGLVGIVRRSLGTSEIVFAIPSDTQLEKQ